MHLIFCICLLHLIFCICLLQYPPEILGRGDLGFVDINVRESWGPKFEVTVTREDLYLLQLVAF